MGIYARRILPRLIDVACGTKRIAEQRRLLVPLASGVVCEIGFGSGLNLPFYDPARVERLVGVEPSAEMQDLARRAKGPGRLAMEALGEDAQAIPLPDASVDTVVSTYTLCTVPDPALALAEIRRVLKPDGMLLFAEHGRAPEARTRRWQDRLDPLWTRAAGGCHLNRDVPALIAAAGFGIESLSQAYLPGPRPLTFNSRGLARSRSSA